MKYYTALLLALIILPVRPESAPDTETPVLSVGDTLETVIEHLGEPTGYMTLNGDGVYYFKLGTVKMSDDKVVAVDLISEAEYKRRKAEKQAALEIRREKGEKILADLKEDKAFSRLTATKQLKILNSFREEYPDVDVFFLYANVKAAAEEEKEERARHQKLAEMERRVQLAAQEAKRAAEELKTQQLFTQHQVRHRAVPVVVYPQSYIIRRSPEYCPDTGRNVTLRAGVSRPSIQVGLNLGQRSSSSTKTTTVSGLNTMYQAHRFWGLPPSTQP